MKKMLLVAAMATVLGVNNMADAAFGVPKLPGAGGAKAEESAPAVDLTNLSATQTRLLAEMALGYTMVLQANAEVMEAMGDKNANKILAAASELKKNQNIKSLKNAKKLNDGIKYDSAALAKIVNGTEEQKAAMKAALNKAGVYKHISYIAFGAAVKDGAEVVQEAGQVLGNVKDLGVIAKVKGMLDTGKMANDMFNGSKASFDALGAATAEAKQVLGVSEPKASDDSVKQAMQEAADGFNLNL